MPASLEKRVAFHEAGHAVAQRKLFNLTPSWLAVFYDNNDELRGWTEPHITLVQTIVTKTRQELANASHAQTSATLTDGLACNYGGWAAVKIGLKRRKNLSVPADTSNPGYQGAEDDCNKVIGSLNGFNIPQSMWAPYMTLAFKVSEATLRPSYLCMREIEDTISVQRLATWPLFYHENGTVTKKQQSRCKFLFSHQLDPIFKKHGI